MARQWTIPVVAINVTWGPTDDSSAYLVGDSATAWRDGSDATYTKLEVSSGGFIGWARGVFEQTALPGLAESTTEVLLRTRVAAPTGSGAPLAQIKLGTSTIALAYTDETAAVWPATPTWVSVPLVFQSGVTLANLIDYLNAGNLTTEFRPIGSAGFYYVYELELFFRARSGLHPCRQFPRADGLAASSARRHYPHDESWQASPRRAGGYY